MSATAMTIEERRAKWREATKRYREKNPDWRERCKASKDRYEKSEKRRAWYRDRHARNAEARNGHKRQRYATDPAYRARVLGANTRWRAMNPARIRVRDINARARRFGAAGVVTWAALEARWDMYAGLCWLCGRAAEGFDHVKPLSRGGSNWPSNMRPACISCNASKGNRLPREVGH